MIECPECGSTETFIGFRNVVVEEEITVTGDTQEIIAQEFGEYVETGPISLLMCQADGCGMTWNPNPQEDDD